MFDQGLKSSEAPAVSSMAVEGASAKRKIDATITNLRNNPDQVADYANGLVLSLSQLANSPSHSEALGKVTKSIDDVKEQTLGVGRDVPLESIDLSHADNQHYAHEMAEGLIQELTFLSLSMDQEISKETKVDTEIDLNGSNFSPEAAPVDILSDLISPVGQKSLPLGVKLPRGLTSDLLKQPTQLESLTSLDEREPLEIINSIIESSLDEDRESEAEKIAVKVEAARDIKEDKSDNPRRAVRATLAREVNPLPWLKLSS